MTLPPTSSGPRDLPRFPLGWHKPTWDELRDYRGKALVLHLPAGASNLEDLAWVECEMVTYDELGRDAKGRTVERPMCWVELRPGSRMGITNLASLAIPGKGAEGAGQRRHG